MREITYTIAHPSGGQKVSGFLKAKGYSVQNLVNLKKDADSIMINGMCARLNSVIGHGDRLMVRIRERECFGQIVPVKLSFEIVYEDEDLFVINKPAGMPVHPSRNNFDNSLGNGLAWLYEERGEPFVYRCINRLDRDTSGLTIVAKHMVSAAILGRMAAEKSAGSAGAGGWRPWIEREYLAVVDGVPCPTAGTVRAPIARKESRCLERTVDFERGDFAVTHYEVLREYRDSSLVRLVLETGRTHQIRVHMKYIGHPLIGDFLYHPLYGANQTDRREPSGAASGEAGVCAPADMDRQALHACRLRFWHPISGERLVFSAPMPEDMQRCLQGTPMAPKRKEDPMNSRDRTDCSLTLFDKSV